MEEYKLSDIAEVRTGPFGSQLHNEDYVSTGTPIVTVEHLGNRRFSKQNLPLVSDDDKKRLSKYLLQEGDIVFSRVGSVDRCSYVTSAENDWLFSGRCLRVRCGNNCHPLFLYYYFCKESVKQYIKSIAVGATMPSINTKLMAEIPILLPKLEEQRCIADILSSFDDKIELNRRINDNLEQQAQALFDHYFDSGSIYLEDSIMGCLTDIAVYLNGLAMQKFPATDIERSLPVLKIKELGQRKCDDCSDRCSDSIDADYIIDNEDIIFSWSGTLMVDVWCGGKCGLNQHLFKVTPLKNYPRWFVYYWTNRHLKKFKLIAKDKAVTMGHIRRGDLENAEVAIPTNLNMLEINARINPLFQSIIDRRLEITKLENIRDALLPKLMSGELTINEI